MWRVVIWLIVLGGATTAGGYFLFRETPLDVTVEPVRRGVVEQTVAAITSGTVMPPRRAMVAAAMLGVISRVHVQEGERVVAGDLLMELEHAELDAQVALAEANLKVGRSRLEQVRIAAQIYREIAAAQLAQSVAQLDQAEGDFERVRALAARNAVSQSDYDKASLALRVARETKIAAEARQKENLVREEEVRSAEAAVEQLEAALRLAEAARDRAFVRAPFDGVVAAVNLKEGEGAAMGLPLMQLVQDEGCYIEAPFDEANAAQIHLGQPVRIEVDAYPDKSFHGEVSYIAPVVATNMDLTRTLNIRVSVKETPELFLPGMSADVTIITGSKENTLYVPSESLIRDQIAYLIEQDRVVRRDVETGIGNWESREILSGLDEGEMVITSVAIRGLRPGVRVRVVEELAGF